MVRRIFLVLENEKYEKLLRIKGDKTWERLLVDDLLECNGVKVESHAVRRGKVHEA